MNVFESVIERLVANAGDETLQKVSAELQAWKEKYPRSYQKVMQGVDQLRPCILEAVKDELAYRNQHDMEE